MYWILTLFSIFSLSAQISKVTYQFSSEPIDIVIPYHPKDFETIELCIQGIRENGKNVRRIIVISDQKYTDSAEWIDEKSYPFSKEDVALEIFQGDRQKAEEFLSHPKTRIGWIFQQLLKLYAPLVIPNISSNVLILDADVIYFRPTDFIDSLGQPYFLPGTNDTKEYFDHAKKLLKGLCRAYPDKSGIVHHMIFQRPIIEDLFHLISIQHQTDPWRAICRCIDLGEIYKSCLSEYEIYFNFVMLRTNQRILRQLRWTEVVPTLNNLDYFRRAGYVFIASQEWYRKWMLEMQATK